MGKREPSPAIGDESYFLTVNRAYPLNFDWEIHEQVLQLSYWVAACLGSHKPFYAIYYKPKAAFIILEIDKQQGLLDRILGEHKWNHILLNPNNHEKAGSSQVFPCSHTTTEHLRKDGWRRIDVEPEWFTGVPLNLFQVNPYPTPAYCSPPPETMTPIRLCRPIPRAVRPKPPELVAPKPAVPGSNDWTTVKTGVRAPPERGRGRGRAAAPRGAARGGTPRAGWDQPVTQTTNKATQKQPNAWKSSSPQPKSPVPTSASQSRTSTPSAWSNGPPPGLDLKNGPPGLIHPAFAQKIAASSRPQFDDEEDEDDPNLPIVSPIEDSECADADDKAQSSGWGGYAIKKAKASDDEPPLCTEHKKKCNAMCGVYHKIVRNWKKEYRKKHGREPPRKPGPYNVKQADLEAEQAKAAEEKRRKEKQKEVDRQKAEQLKAEKEFRQLEATRTKEREEADRRRGDSGMQEGGEVMAERGGRSVKMAWADYPENEEDPWGSDVDGKGKQENNPWGDSDDEEGAGESQSEEDQRAPTESSSPPIDAHTRDKKPEVDAEEEEEEPW